MSLESAYTAAYRAHAKPGRQIRFPWTKRLMALAALTGAASADSASYKPLESRLDTVAPTERATLGNQSDAIRSDSMSPYIIALFKPETSAEATVRFTDSLYHASKLSEAQAHFLQITVPLALEIEERYGIPAEAIVAKAAVESRNGTSGLAREDNNLFGMKWRPALRREYPQRSRWTTWEHHESNRIRDWFITYTNEQESVEHFARYLHTKRDSTGKLMYARVISERRPSGFLFALAESGFSTDSLEFEKTVTKLYELHLYGVFNAARKAAQEYQVYTNARAYIGRAPTPTRIADE